MRLQSALFVLFLSLGLPLDARAQGFSVGSNGSDGAVSFTTSVTLPIPESGVYQATTFAISAGVTVTFTPNPLNTPLVILAQDAITIDGTLRVNGESGTATLGGRPGPGGFGGGAPGSLSSAPGDGLGPGGGRNDPNCSAARAAGHVLAQQGQVYGNRLLVPLVGGSGGGGCQTVGGGGGGGAILLASDLSVRVNGTVQAIAGFGNGCFGVGSGGVIRLLAPAVTGSGSLNTQASCGSAESRGRVRIDTLAPAGAGTLASRSVAEETRVESFMTVEPMNLPSLEIVSVGSRSIAPGAPATVVFNFGSSPTQNVVVRGRQFTQNTPIELVLTPQAGSRMVMTRTLVPSGQNPVDVTFPATFPLNLLVDVAAYAR